MKKKIIICLITMLLIISTQGFAKDTDIKKIINKMKEAHGAAYKVAQRIEIQIKSKGKDVSKLIAGKAEKQTPAGKHVLIVLLEPDIVKGFAFLYKEKNEIDIERWIYPPAINRIRKLNEPWNAYDSFLNTDFTYADIGWVDTKGIYTLLGEEKLQGIPVYKVEKISKSPIKYYSKIIIWISKETYLPIRKDIYDIKNRLFKKQLFENIIMVGQTPVPYKITMESLYLNSSTVLLVKELKSGLDIELPDAIFRPERLIYSSTCPIWERICYESEKK